MIKLIKMHAVGALRSRICSARKVRGGNSPTRELWDMDIPSHNASVRRVRNTVSHSNMLRG